MSSDRSIVVSSSTTLNKTGLFFLGKEKRGTERGGWRAARVRIYSHDAGTFPGIIPLHALVIGTSWDIDAGEPKLKE